ncbi:DUF1934 domain-containing protein [Bacillus salitolerans]|uniref:DUF1934 domain-containing protein n=1 Tax=Bacillus salitolerans TaxID=1437434 RepID=A0ABW4LKB2_9BACI
MGQSEGVAVQITFSSEINDQGEKAHFSFATTGLYYIKGRNSYLRFDEKLHNGESVKTTVRWSNHEAWIKRTGTVTMKLPFIVGETTKGMYENVQGKMEMTANTDKIQSSWNPRDKQGDFELQYRLSMLGNKLGIYQIVIQFKEENHS